MSKTGNQQTVGQDQRTTGRRIRHYLEWVLLRGVMAFIRRGDIVSAYHRLQGLSLPLRKILQSEWRWAHFNLQLVYGPNITEQQRHRLAAMAFENVLRSHIDGMRVMDFHFSGTDALKQLKPLQEVFQQGKGVILCAVHLGTWEAALKILAANGIPIGVVYRHANNPLSEQEFIQVREPYHVQWIRRDDPRATLRVLREKKVLVLMTDINQRQHGISAPFFDVPALSPVGTARLAKRFQCPVIAGACIRERPGEVSFHFKSIELATADGEEQTLETITAQINHQFEAWIHTYAEQYNWLHARWRSRPDGTLWNIKDQQVAQTLLNTLDASRNKPYPHLSARVQKLLA